MSATPPPPAVGDDAAAAVEAPASEHPAPTRWTCGVCSVEVSWADSHKQRELPANWAEDHREGPVCLHCRRELAADAAVSSGDLSRPERARLRSSTIVDFEVRRTPERSNTQIAGAVHTSVGAVLKARKRLAASGSPV